jgi:hypothetical protein
MVYNSRTREPPAGGRFPEVDCLFNKERVT